jgi:hypothetical protein
MCTPPLAVLAAGMPVDEAGSAKANGREPKTGLGRVFNFKLGCLDDVRVVIYADARQHLQLKTRPRFSPVSLSLSMDEGNSIMVFGLFFRDNLRTEIAALEKDIKARRDDLQVSVS